MFLMLFDWRPLLLRIAASLLIGLARRIRDLARPRPATVTLVVVQVVVMARR